MRGGYPVAVVRCERYQRVFDWPELIEVWWEVSTPTNSRLHTNCGHKHGSEEEAKGCIEAVTKAYVGKRWPKMLRTSNAKRR